MYNLKILFKNEESLNLYIKFEYKQLKDKLNNTRIKSLELFKEANFANSIKSLSEQIENYSKFALPSDILNNLKLIIEIAKNVSQLKRTPKYYFIILPIEIEEKTYDASDLDKGGNSHKREIRTDIDAMLIIIENNFFEFFIIEGKDQKTSFQKDCNNDLNTIQLLFKNPELIKERKLINNLAKGGYLKISNK